MLRRWGAAALAVCVLVAGCNRGAGKDEGGAAKRAVLEPRFAPDPGASATTVPGSASTSAPVASTTTVTGPGGTARAPRPAGQVAGPVIAGASTAAVNDSVGDLTPSPADPPPPWADLAGATLIRRAHGFELRVAVGGGTAPSSTDADHTMNIAAFFDVDGNGSIDFEVWANLASGGWGGSYFDNVKGRAAFQEKSGVAVSVEGPEVVVRFPLSHLVSAEKFRWALASEWGRYEVLGTIATARDDAPDDDGAAQFPG